MLRALPPHTLIIQCAEGLALPIGVIRRARRTLIAVTPGQTRAELHAAALPLLYECELELMHRSFGEAPGAPLPMADVVSTDGWITVCRAGERPVPLAVRHSLNTRRSEHG